MTGNPSTSAFKTAAKRRGTRSAFTLIELLVAMAILLIIVVIVAQIFQQANVAWSTGLRSVETTMKGRSLAEFIAQDLSQAISTNSSSYSVTASGAKFLKLGEVTVANGYKAIWNVEYDWSGTTVKRDGVDMAEGIDKVEVTPAGSTMPSNLTVTVTVSTNIFQTRVFLLNRERYSF